MGKLSARVKQRQERLSAPRWERVQRVFTLAAHASQVLLLLLGVFGYFYTVLPVYQKSLLDEEIAQKTLELREQQRQSRELGEKISQQNQEVERKQRELQAKDRELSVARSAEMAARVEAQENYARLRIQYIGGATGRLWICASTISKDGLTGRELAECPDKVLALVGDQLNDLRAKDAALFRKLLEAKLTGLRPEFQSLVSRYNERVAANEVKLAELRKKAEDRANSKESFNAQIQLAFGGDETGLIRREVTLEFQRILDKAGAALLPEYLDAVSR